MFRLDYFSSASERWRSDALGRARRVRIDHCDDPVAYAEKRMKLAKAGSFERRRWKFIRKILIDKSDE